MTAQTHGSPTRPPRPLDGSLLHVEAPTTFERLRGEQAFMTDGRNSETVVSEGPTRVIVTVVDAGRHVGGEHSDGHVSVVLLEGHGTLTRGDAEAALSVGSLAVLAPGAAWSLRAETPCAFVASFWQG
jgi:quercetin dioxygenase-like cupin family protein